MDETRQSARQRAACQAILVDAHCRVRAHLWRKRRMWERSNNAEIIDRALMALWKGIVQFPNQALLASYLQNDGRRFCLETMREARTTLRFVAAGGVVLTALGVGAFGLMGVLPILATMILIGITFALPVWLTFLGLEWIEYRTSSYLALAVDTAARRMSLLSGSTPDESI